MADDGITEIESFVIVALAIAAGLLFICFVVVCCFVCTKRRKKYYSSYGYEQDGMKPDLYFDQSDKDGFNEKVKYRPTEIPQESNVRLTRGIDAPSYSKWQDTNRAVNSGWYKGDNYESQHVGQLDPKQGDRSAPPYNRLNEGRTILNVPSPTSAQNFTPASPPAVEPAKSSTTTNITVMTSSNKSTPQFVLEPRGY